MLDERLITNDQRREGKRGQQQPETREAAG